MRGSAVLIITSVNYEVAGEADGCDTPMRETCTTVGARTTANPIDRMVYLGGDDCLKSSRTLRHAPA